MQVWLFRGIKTEGSQSLGYAERPLVLHPMLTLHGPWLTPAWPTDLHLLDESASVILEVSLGLQLVLQVLQRLLQKLPFRECFVLSSLVVPYLLLHQAHLEGGLGGYLGCIGRASGQRAQRRTPQTIRGCPYPAVQKTLSQS